MSPFNILEMDFLAGDIKIDLPPDEYSGELVFADSKVCWVMYL